ncbi:glutamate receptor 2.7 isoform X2 [Amborella trichopoda]|nr:glutamate receptor 2.7 isoform X2 [Amborella trichopoda]|eukprot:XP_020523715.1 glutamate receptor 2.7 isoform X2 [Amborella trichopoda]
MKGSFFVCVFMVFLHQGFADENEEANGNGVVKIGVVLAMGSLVGRASNMCISIALQDFYRDNPNFTSRLHLSTRDSGGDVVQAASAALDLIKNVEVQAIIGPQTSAEAQFLSDLANKSQIPVISFSATSPSLSSTHTPYFIRAIPSDSIQAKPIASLIKFYKWRQAIVVYEDTDYGAGFIPYLTDALSEIGSRLQHRTLLPSVASDELIRKELYKVMTMQTRVFVVHMSYPLASRFFRQVKQLGMMSRDYAWIITDGLTNLLNSMDPWTIDSMRGVLGVRAYIEGTQRLDKFSTRWKRYYRKEYPNEIDIPHFNVFCLRAYDATRVLALAVEKSGGRSVGFLRPTAGQMTANSTDLLTLGISPVGPRLLSAILDTKLKGLTGTIRFVNGEIQGSTFQIVNVVDKSVREIGFWSPEAGISREISRKVVHRRSNDVENLGPVIWPGESTVTPKGWVFPTNGVKMKIGVPVKKGFKEFVNVEWGPLDGRPTTTGFSVDVFHAVVKGLPYGLDYEFVPFADDHRKKAGTYNELVYQVFLGKYDAVVGDVTIIANRSNYVDLTPPYTESGVSMIVPVRKERGSRALTFLKPLTWELWVTASCFFFFMAFVVWFLEHRINDDFQGPPSEQVGRALYFSFSTLVFAQRDKITSNLTRFVIILWLFLLLILTNSYTANLASILTVEQLQPTVTDVQTLIRNEDIVGYQGNSFVEDLLIKLGISRSKLIEFDSAEEYVEALSKGSSHGGVAAIFDEIPYIKSFLSNRTNDFMMVGPTYRTGGFGFVFPKNSLLLSDISSSVLNVTEGETMVSLEKRWFPKQDTSSSWSYSPSSKGLSLDSFWGLFLMVGTASMGALIIFFIGSCNEHWNRTVSETTPMTKGFWPRIVAMAKHYIERDLSLHTFRRKQRKEGETEENREVALAPTVTENPLSSHTNAECLSIEDGSPPHSTSVSADGDDDYAPIQERHAPTPADGDEDDDAPIQERHAPTP